MCSLKHCDDNDGGDDDVDVTTSGIEDCYEPDIIGPYNITILIEPPLSGEVDVNTIEPNSFPWTGTYFGGIDIELDADAYAGYEFDYWEPFLHVVNPSILDEKS